MEKLNTEDGQLFIKNLARFVRTHEKALANALHLRRQSSKSADLRVSQATSSNHASNRSSAPSSLASALSFVSPRPRPAKLTLTPHHLFYLLSRFEELTIAVGPMNIRLENINAEASSAYVSFLNKPQRSKTDRDSIHSVSSARSVGTTMGAFWASFGLGSKDTESKTEKAKAAIDADLKYLYSSFTKIPCLKLAPDYKARLIRGYEEFPFDTAVPLHAFKNLSALEIIDIDFRSFFGWDRLAEQLRTLTLKRANIDDPAELLTRIVLDDIDKRRRRSSKSQQSPVLGSASTSASPQPLNTSTPGRSASAPGSPMAKPILGTSTSPQQGGAIMSRGASEGVPKGHTRTTSISPTRQASPRHPGGRRHTRGSATKITRSASGSSNSSETSAAYPNSSTSNLLTAGVLPVSKWRFLRHLSLADNSLTSINASSLAPVASTLHSLDLSCNLFTEVPDSLASLVSLRSLNLSNCMIDSLHSLAKNPLPAITALNLRGNRLRSIAGVERLPSLERLDLRENNIPDPTEVARLTSIPDIREIWVSGNPFTKSYYGYRVTIFNLFRQTPGFSEDVIIDSTGPGYTEKKQLVVRIAEPKSAPVIRPPEPEELTPAEPTKQATAPRSSPSATKELPEAEIPARGASLDQTVGSGRRKKNQRRRVIDLSQDGPAPLEDQASAPVKQTLADPFVATVPEEIHETREEGQGSGQGSARRTSTGTSRNTTKAQPKSRSDKHILDASSTKPSSSSRSLMPAIEGLDRDLISGDVYRQRLEALKQEVGTNWLTVLGEDKWDNSQSPGIGPHPGVSEFGPAGSIRPTSLPRTNSQAMVTGARTLG